MLRDERVSKEGRLGAELHLIKGVVEQNLARPACVGRADDGFGSDVRRGSESGAQATEECRPVLVFVNVSEMSGDPARGRRQAQKGELGRLEVDRIGSAASRVGCRLVVVFD